MQTDDAFEMRATGLSHKCNNFPHSFLQQLTYVFICNFGNLKNLFDFQKQGFSDYLVSGFFTFYNACLTIRYGWKRVKKTARCPYYKLRHKITVPSLYWGSAALCIQHVSAPRFALFVHFLMLATHIHTYCLPLACSL